MRPERTSGKAAREKRRPPTRDGWVLSRSANPQPSRGIAPRRRLLARTYRQLDLDQRRTLFRLVEARRPVGEIAERPGRHPSTIRVSEPSTLLGEESGAARASHLDQ